MSGLKSVDLTQPGNGPWHMEKNMGHAGIWHVWSDQQFLAFPSEEEATAVCAALNAVGWVAIK